MPQHPVIALEEAALARWCQGDPSGFLEISAPDVVYFDPFQPQRLNGLKALTEYYESIRGQVLAKQHEMKDAHVQEAGEAAVLTFQFHSQPDNGGTPFKWNCTEVYRRKGTSWEIIHTNWSFAAA